MATVLTVDADELEPVQPVQTTQEAWRELAGMASTMGAPGWLVQELHDAAAWHTGEHLASMYTGVHKAIIARDWELAGLALDVSSRRCKC